MASHSKRSRFLLMCVVCMLAYWPEVGFTLHDASLRRQTKVAMQAEESREQRASPTESALPEIEPTVEDAFFESFGKEIVPVDLPWQTLMEKMKKPAGLLLRAPPRSGKTFLGLAACDQATCPKVVTEKGFTVEYFSSILSFLSKHPDPEEASTYSSTKNIIFYVDEAQAAAESDNAKLKQNAQKLDANWVAAFFKTPRGRAVFVSPMSNPFGEGVTPAEVVKNTVVLTRPAPWKQMEEWVVQRLQLLEMENELEVAQLLMELTDGHIGLIQSLGQSIEQDADCRSLGKVKKHLLAQLKDLVRLGDSARCFGTQNGNPNAEQAEMISVLRCTGNVTAMTEPGQSEQVFNGDKSDLRRGFNRAFYAPVESSPRDPISDLGDVNRVRLVNPIQSEIYAAAFKGGKAGWKGLAFEHRWVRNFRRAQGTPLDKPEHVVDLMLSWMSHISTATLLGVKVTPNRTNVDPAERVVQKSLESFLRDELGMQYRREYEVCNLGDGGGRLDFLIVNDGDKSPLMGVELLIRSSVDNEGPVPKEEKLLQPETRCSLMRHMSRTCAQLADVLGQISYEKTAAAACKQGYSHKWRG